MRTVWLTAAVDVPDARLIVGRSVEVSEFIIVRPLVSRIGVVSCGKAVGGGFEPVEGAVFVEGRGAVCLLKRGLNGPAEVQEVGDSVISHDSRVRYIGRSQLVEVVDLIQGLEGRWGHDEGTIPLQMTVESQQCSEAVELFRGARHVIVTLRCPISVKRLVVKPSVPVGLRGLGTSPEEGALEQGPDIDLELFARVARVRRVTHQRVVGVVGAITQEATDSVVAQNVRLVQMDLRLDIIARERAAEVFDNGIGVSDAGSDSLQEEEPRDGAHQHGCKLV